MVSSWRDDGHVTRVTHSPACWRPSLVVLVSLVEREAWFVTLSSPSLDIALDIVVPCRPAGRVTGLSIYTVVGPFLVLFSYAFLTMPKDPKPRSARAPRKLTSTEERRLRAERIRQRAAEMPFRCKRCEEKNLRCFVDTVTGRCAGCIAAHSDCSLFVSEEDWEKIEVEKREARLALLRSEAETAKRKLELAEIESREQEYARRDLAVLRVQDQAQETESSSTTAPQTSDLSADLGWSQANNFTDPSFDHFLADFGTSFDFDVGSFFPLGELVE